MGFDKFGKISYTKETKIAGFVHHLEEGKIAGTRCRACGTLYFPPRADCASCLSSDVDWIELNGRGRLITYTTAHFAPVGFEDEAPYTLALVELDEGPRVFARLSEDIPEDGLQIGMNLKLVPRRLPEERISYELRKP
jgi:uncharacterized OB-fold protein